MTWHPGCSEKLWSGEFPRESTGDLFEHFRFRGNYKANRRIRTDFGRFKDFFCLFVCLFAILDSWPVFFLARVKHLRFKQFQQSKSAEVQHTFPIKSTRFPSFHRSRPPRSRSRRRAALSPVTAHLFRANLGDSWVDPLRWSPEMPFVRDHSPEAEWVICGLYVACCYPLVN